MASGKTEDGTRKSHKELKKRNTPGTLCEWRENTWPNRRLTARICVASLTFVSKSHCACTLRLHCCEPATSSCCSSCRTLLLDNVRGPCCGDGDVGCCVGSDRAAANRPEVSKFCRGSSASVNFRPPRWNCCCCRCCWKTPSKPIGVCCCSCCRCCTAYLRTGRMLGAWTGDNRRRRKNTRPLQATKATCFSYVRRRRQSTAKPGRPVRRLHGFAVEIGQSPGETPVFTRFLFGR